MCFRIYEFKLYFLTHQMTISPSGPTVMNSEPRLRNISFENSETKGRSKGSACGVVRCLYCVRVLSVHLCLSITIIRFRADFLD